MVEETKENQYLWTEIYLSIRDTTIVEHTNPLFLYSQGSSLIIQNYKTILMLDHMFGVCWRMIKKLKNDSEYQDISL